MHLEIADDARFSADLHDASHQDLWHDLRFETTHDRTGDYFRTIKKLRQDGRPGAAIRMKDVQGLISVSLSV